jgi:hypothetical protein
MEKHTHTTSVLVCTLSTRRGGVDLHMPLSQICCVQLFTSIRQARQKRF